MMEKNGGYANRFDDLDDDTDALLADFEPTPVEDDQDEAKRKTEQILKGAKETANDQGFSAPARRKKKTKFRRSDKLRTGRNEHIAMRGTLDDKKRLADIIDARGWVAGQTLQYALDALQEKIENPEDSFWQTRNFHGVD